MPKTEHTEASGILLSIIQQTMYFCSIIHHTLYYVNVIFAECVFSPGGLEERMHYTRLRDLREDCDLTQEQLVEALGMHKTNLYQL